jgi:hypothetical protein
METDKQMICPDCGSLIANNPRTGKNFCSAKCWLNKPTSPAGKVVRYPQVESFAGGYKAQPKKEFDNKSYYVAYAKDLCIAMLQVHAERIKQDPKVEPLDVCDLMVAAVGAIKEAKNLLQ